MADTRYTKEHEWVHLDGKIATVGISEHAQAQLGDIVFVELPSTGSALEQFGTFGVVESVKAVSDIYAPASGEVVAVNAAVQERPEVVNEDPYGDGWLIRVRLADPGELDALMDESAYREYLAGL